MNFEFEVGQKFLVPSDDRTREIVAIVTTRTKPIRVTEVVLRCIDCVVSKKDLTVEVELMEKRLKSGMYVFQPNGKAE